MNMSKLILLLAILMSSIYLTASEIYPPILNSFNAAHSIDTSFQLISSYDRESQEVFIQFNLSQESTVTLELYDTEHHMVKIWEPQVAQSGTYNSTLNISDVANGRYRMLVYINEEIYQQAVFKL